MAAPQKCFPAMVKKSSVWNHILFTLVSCRKCQLSFVCCRKVRLDVRNEQERRNITNILGILEGEEEPGEWNWSMIHSSLTKQQGFSYNLSARGPGKIYASSAHGLRAEKKQTNKEKTNKQMQTAASYFSYISLFWAFQTDVSSWAPTMMRGPTELWTRTRERLF